MSDGIQIPREETPVERLLRLDSELITAQSVFHAHTQKCPECLRVWRLKSSNAFCPEGRQLAAQKETARAAYETYARTINDLMAQHG